MSFPNLGAVLMAAAALLWLPAAHAQEAERNQSSGETAQDQPERCLSMPDEAQCQCVYDRARASGATDDQITLVLDHPIDNYTPPSGIERETFIQIRRAQTTCAVIARYAQPGGEDIGEIDASGDSSSNSDNPQPDGSYIGRPVRPTPRQVPAEEVDPPTYDGPCSASTTLAAISPFPPR